MKYIISVIIPVYNGEKYFRECVDSILAQTFKDFEIVMVDDGSKDASGVICDEYANKYDNIQTIHQENSGVTMARKKGIQVANGTWISFVDADDTLPHDAIQNLAQSISDETDIIMGNINEDTAKNVIDLEQCRQCMVKGKYLHPGILGKLIRKSLFNDYVTDIPREIFKGEDQLMNIRLLFETTKIPAFVKKNVYNYRRNMVSVSHTRKASVEYEAFYDKYRVSSIPVSELNKYMHEIISIRLNGLIGCALSDPATLCKKDYPYLQIIKNDISEYHYNLNTIEHLLLSFRFPWLYRILASFIMVKNSLKYRLRL